MIVEHAVIACLLLCLVCALVYIQNCCWVIRNYKRLHEAFRDEVKAMKRVIDYLYARRKV